MAEENGERKSRSSHSSIAFVVRVSKREGPSPKCLPRPQARVARNKRIADRRNLGLPNRLPRLETMDVDRAFILLDVMHCTHTTPNMTENAASKIS
jgi:hypothetical protein